MPKLGVEIKLSAFLAVIKHLHCQCLAKTAKNGLFRCRIVGFTGNKMQFYENSLNLLENS